jgi:hypothetical protein
MGKVNCRRSLDEFLEEVLVVAALDAKDEVAVGCP